jgi:hypothetical protein
MKKTITFILALLSFTTAFAQWKYKTVDNGFDEKFKIAYVEDATDNFVKLFGGAGEPIGMLLYTGFNCEEDPTVEIALLVGANWEKYEVTGTLSEDRKKVFITYDISIMVDDFKSSSLMRVRHNDGHCGTRIYEFNMSGSTAAYNFINNP